MLEPGETAPDFELPNQDGEPVALSDFEGQPVVLYFYPKAGTQGCTTQACSFRDSWDDYEDAGVAVLGVSVDEVEDLAAFKAEQNLPFDLLSDPEGEVADAYESFGTVEVEGETFDIAFRNTYVIGADGTIRSAHEGVSPEGHAEEMLAEV